MTDPLLGKSAGEDSRPLPALLGRYRVEKSLGSGGMGEVLLARDDLLRRRVALKRMFSEGEDREDRRKAILREARRASPIHHPRVAAIYDVLDLPDDVVLVMEYVDGVTLRQRMAEPITLPEFWRLATQCVEGLAAAHAHGVIHRDIKPENLMVTESGEVKILDFGIAKRTESADGTTTSHSESGRPEVAGTPHYMAPEALLGRPVDPRADLFSLGVVFYEMLTTQRPFAGSTFAELANRILNSTPSPLTDSRPEAGANLARVIAKMLAKDPSDRFSSAHELLERLTETRAEGATPVSLEVPAVPRHDAIASQAPPAQPRRKRARAAIAVLALAAVAAVGILWRASAAPALPKDVNLAVLAPATPGADANVSAFALGMMEHIAGRLRRHSDRPGFQMASFNEGREEKVRTAADARKILGTNLALLSTIEQGPDQLRARIELREGKSERVIASRSIQVPAAEPFRFLDQVLGAACAMLRLPIPTEEASAAIGFRGAGTLRFYLQGMGKRLTAESESNALAAASDLETACRTEPDAAVARAGLAAAQLRASQFADDPALLARAEATARAAVAQAPGRPEPHRVLGFVLIDAKKNSKSLISFTRARDLDPTDDEAYLKIARAHARLGEHEEEGGAYLEAIRRQPHWWQAYWWLAAYYLRDRKIPEALHAYEQMIRRAPEYSKGYANLGAILVLSGRYTGAIDTLKLAIALRPTAAAFDNLGTAYFNSGRFAEAVDAYNQSFQFGEAGYGTWLNLGDAYYWLHDRKDQAAEAYAQTIRLGREEERTRAERGRPVDALIPANLATVFPKLGQPDSARVYLARALSADSANSQVQYSAALTLWQLFEKERAIAWLQKSVANGYPVAWLRDSPVFREWREVAEFRALVDGADSKDRKPASGT